MNLQCTFGKTSWNEFNARFSSNTWLIETPQVQSKTLSKSRLKQPRCKHLKKCSTKHFLQWFTFLEATKKIQTGDRSWCQHLLSNQDLSLMHKTQAESANYRKTTTRNYNGLNKATREVTHASWAVKTRILPRTYSFIVECPKISVILLKGNFKMTKQMHANKIYTTNV